MIRAVLLDLMMCSVNWNWSRRKRHLHWSLLYFLKFLLRLKLEMICLWFTSNKWRASYIAWISTFSWHALNRSMTDCCVWRKSVWNEWCSLGLKRPQPLHRTERHTRLGTLWLTSYRKIMNVTHSRSSTTFITCTQIKIVIQFVCVCISFSKGVYDNSFKEWQSIDSSFVPSMLSISRLFYCFLWREKCSRRASQ